MIVRLHAVPGCKVQMRECGSGAPVGEVMTAAEFGRWVEENPDALVVYNERELLDFSAVVFELKDAHA